MIFYKIKVGNRFYSQKDKCIYPNSLKGTRSYTTEEVKELYAEAKFYFKNENITILKIEETEINLETL